MPVHIERVAGRLLVICLLAAVPALAERCDDPTAGTVAGRVDFGRVVRADVPHALFGFNVPWRDFQISFWRNGAVRADLVELLKPFKGASYRYPGGSPSNSFDWAMSRGPLADRQPVHADHGRRAKVEFGLAEFAGFLDAVDGQAMLTVNLTGTADAASPLAAVQPDAEVFAKQVLVEFKWPCKPTGNCRLQALELGNELDWPPYNMGPIEYAGRANSFRSAVASQFAGITWVVAGKTAPWERKGQPYDSFNQDLLVALAPGVRGLAIHPYYDGLPVTEALGYVGKFADAMQRVAPDGAVYVSEHARWPARPAAGPWQQTWHTTTSMGGALATADFLLGILPMPAVKSANWHALAANGPWQLVQVDQANDRLVPSALYWAMRLLREGMQADVVDLTYKPTNMAGYGGQYDQRLVAMRAGAQRSVLGINRSRAPALLQIDVKGQLARSLPGRLAWVAASDVDAHNTLAAPNTVRPQSRLVAASAGEPGISVCVPALSVFAISLTP